MVGDRCRIWRDATVCGCVGEGCWQEARLPHIWALPTRVELVCFCRKHHDVEIHPLLYTCLARLHSTFPPPDVLLSMPAVRQCFDANVFGLLELCQVRRQDSTVRASALQCSRTPAAVSNAVCLCHPPLSLSLFP